MLGKPVFFGTRVTVRALFDTIAAGGTLDEFLESFPSVTREQVQAVLNEAAAAFEKQ